MKSTATIALIAGMSTTLAGCQGMVWGNVAMLGVTFCLFFGTLSLGRQQSSGSTGGANKPGTAQPATRVR